LGEETAISPMGDEAHYLLVIWIRRLTNLGKKADFTSFPL
jgi:hypothetical protein